MRTRRGGFVMIVAITLLALAAAAVTVVLQLAHDDGRRTVAERVDAQRRQLLIAGLRDVEARLNAGGTPTTGPIAVPAEAEATLGIDAVESPAADRAIVTIRSEALAQRATFTRGADGGAWQLERAEIVR